MSDDNFLSRWSRRKRGEDAAQTPAKTVAPPPPDVAISQDVIEKKSNPNIDGHFQVKVPETANGSTSLQKPSTPPTSLEQLPDPATLNMQSDFTPFMARGVPPETRNQAMKALFTDPHFNVMDRLDIYIDDYGKADPLPAGWLEKMNQSKMLGLFDDKPEETVDDANQAPAPTAAPQIETTASTNEKLTADHAVAADLSLADTTLAEVELGLPKPESQRN